MSYKRPLFRWAGSKRQMLSTLAQYWQPRHTRYVEPFAGSACLFFAINPGQALITDINRELITVYETVKNEPDQVADFLSSFELGKEAYYRLRALDPYSLVPEERAARFLFLNRSCFNGLYRTNKAGVFNVPYGGMTANLPSREALVEYSHLLASANFVACDFEATLEQAREGDLVYMDPPYRVSAQPSFQAYDPAGFSLADLQRLRTWMETLTERRIDFVVSYAECDEATFLTEGYEAAFVNVRRSIAGFLGSRKVIREVVISNRLCI